ncbi:periodic tryptophan protein 2 [Dorcoceras hygrometricum]|uniref:Periodic tryptophan protein 2 n=1 Tax=Dorcoceras hygrometricum TaxID=472368 RepID=A0A2Z7CT45_9LAMI|nr:periodic tryptophan protein 2 [Dorcoceras hygrometricum]
MPLKDFVKKRRRQRQHTQMGWTAATIASQPDPTPVSPTDADDQMVQGGGGDCLEFDARKEHEGKKDQKITADESEGSHYDSIPTAPVEGEGNFKVEHLNTCSNEHEKIDSEHDAQMGDDDQIENQGCDTQLDFVNPTAKDSGAIQNEPVQVKE